ncbi:MAG TPA: 50S ribosomal protein L9 [Candidatus Paceibacterota bacterium]|nr:50S ribosomal protein L9 [Candidatus Paceibacterota bacterium]
MKVILLRDVARIGKKSDVKEVPDGHAINFLIPRNMAIPASAENLKKNQGERVRHDTQAQQEREQFDASMAILKDVVPQHRAQANEQGHLFKGVGIDDIVATCNQIPGVRITRKHITLPHPIKDVGVHEIKLRHGDSHAVIRFEIIM